MTYRNKVAEDMRLKGMKMREFVVLYSAVRLTGIKASELVTVPKRRDQLGRDI